MKVLPRPALSFGQRNLLCGFQFILLLPILSGVVWINLNQNLNQVSCLGDTDGDGKQELAVGSPFFSKSQVENNDYHTDHMGFRHETPRR